MNRNKLVVFWSKREEDFLIRYPRSCDGHLAAHIFTSDRIRRATPEERADHGMIFDFDQSFVKELEARGYDTKTLRFSVERRGEKEAGEKCR